jgi:hypothetical protein
MALHLSERQQKAADLAREIQRMGAWVTNVMPLDDSARLRFQVLDVDRPRIIQTLTDWEWSPAFCGTLPRIYSDGWKLASMFEIDLPRERMPIHDDRKIQGEIARPKKTDTEVEAVMRYLGWPK